MSDSHEQHINAIEGAGVNHDQPHGTKAIWKTFWILFAITMADIGFYFGMHPSMLRNWLFIFFGIVKAFYIVGIFMHMKYERKNLIQTIILPILFVLDERKNLIQTIILPILFVLGLVGTLIYEGNFWDSININLD